MSKLSDNAAMELKESHHDDADVSSKSEEGFSNIDNTGSSSSANRTPDIAALESRHVFCARLFVMVILFLVAAGISTAVFIITTHSQEQEFNAQWQAKSLQILNSFNKIVKEKFGAISTLGNSYTAYARGQNESWPFVTMNDYQQRAAVARRVSNALHTQIMPIVTGENREKWEKYSVQNSGWLHEGIAYQQSLGLDASWDSYLTPLDPSSNDPGLDFSSGIPNKIFSINFETGLSSVSTSPPNYFPSWQQSPVPYYTVVNWNFLEMPLAGPFMNVCAATGQIVVGGCDIFPPGNISSPNSITSWYAFLLSFVEGKLVEYTGDPMTPIFLPVFDSYSDDRKVVAVIYAAINWRSYFVNILPKSRGRMMVVLSNSCQGPFTYVLDGPHVDFIGAGDFHSMAMDNFARHVELQDLLSDSISGFDLNQDVCQYNLTVYPTTQMYNEYNTNYPLYSTLTVCLIFAITCFMFVVYDRLVERRQHIVMKQASKTSAIVSSLFPESITRRLLADKTTKHDKKFLSQNNRLQSFLSSHDGDEQKMLHAKPIADLFPYTTVLFGDIAGFTSWSSSRDPSHVFLLLETIYSAFDKLAAKHKVFKVETIGDCYVAVTGLPKPQEQHAVLMARFALDGLVKFEQLTIELETTLGPATTELGIRFGMHSGPVTAGVLRGEKSRFQLFGDTVNTAARMESSGMAGRIQISHATADHLIALHKQHWLQKRDDSVVAKGKGVFETYWIKPHRTKSSDGRFSTTTTSPDDIVQAVSRQDRLVDWIVGVMADCIRQVAAKNKAIETAVQNHEPMEIMLTPPPNSICLDEIVDTINLPKFDANANVKAAAMKDHHSVEIPTVVEDQLRACVSAIAALYRDNHFHNFEHACHVTMCVDKFLKRIVAPDVDETMDQRSLALALHDYSHGITSDPLTILAILFSALAHDADHRGVSNAQLAKEDEGLARHYRQKSIAEQNSLDLTWNILMSDSFGELRGFIFANQVELQRFRQVCVNVVLATDIFDKELNDRRKSRWNIAFDQVPTEDYEWFRDLRATLVIEHIIQASDVCHTMQHWHIYRKWNERLFLEMSEAHREGRMANDPAVFWYQGELAFFDKYIIPLAKKLKECGVFGVSSDECLNYAIQNRNEWEERGERIILELVEKAKASDRLKSVTGG